MKETDEEEKVLRQYLLGELDEADQERVEELFLSDPSFQERLLITEDELVEDYLADELSQAEKVLFTNHFLATPEQRRKLGIADSLQRYIAALPVPPAPASGDEVLQPGARKSRIKNQPFWRNPLVFAPVSFALLLLMALVAVWQVGIQQQRNRFAEIRRQFEQVNNQPVDATAPSILLTPLKVRGGGVPSTSLNADNADRQLWLQLITEEYQNYQVVLQKDGDTEQLPLSDRRAVVTPHGKAIPLRIPSRVLTPGVYIVKLNGIAGGGRIEEVGEYSFQLTP
jgi:hypothetical protein